MFVTVWWLRHQYIRQFEHTCEHLSCGLVVIIFAYIFQDSWFESFGVLQFQQCFRIVDVVIWRGFEKYRGLCGGIWRQERKIERCNIWGKSVLASIFLYFNMCCQLFPIFVIVVACILITYVIHWVHWICTFYWQYWFKVTLD